MTYKESLEYIRADVRSRPGLERISELMNMMGNPQDKLKFIHVSGTNGKGSVCSMLSNVFKCAGYKTGLFVSPFVRCFNEFMSVDGNIISDEDLAEITDYVKKFADKMKDRPTEYELITAIAFEFFYRKKSDIVILEVCMGGRLDSTNIIKTTEISVITGISLEHTQFLGDTIEKIATEKAGIIKEGKPCVYGGKDLSAEKVIRQIASQRNAPYFSSSENDLLNIRVGLNGTKFDYQDNRDYFTTLIGNYQPMNIATTMKTLNIARNIGYTISDIDIRNGLSKVYCPARFEILSNNPLFIYDGAHNPDGLRACIDSLKNILKEQKVIILCGVMADKDTNTMISMLSEIALRIYTVTPNNPRSLKSCEFAEILNKSGIEAYSYNNLIEGLKSALSDAKENNITVIALGTLYMYSEIISYIENNKI